MANFAFVLLLTLTLQSGEEEPYKRIRLWAVAPKTSYDACNQEKAAEVKRFQTVWTFLADHTTPDADLKGVEAICVGIAPGEKLPETRELVIR